MKTYVVMFWDTIEYAGNSLKMAKKTASTQKSIWVWKSGKCVGWIAWDSIKKEWKETVVQ